MDDVVLMCYTGTTISGKQTWLMQACVSTKSGKQACQATATSGKVSQGAETGIEGIVSSTVSSITERVEPGLNRLPCVSRLRLRCLVVLLRCFQFVLEEVQCQQDATYQAKAEQDNHRVEGAPCRATTDPEPK